MGMADNIVVAEILRMNLKPDDVLVIKMPFRNRHDFNELCRSLREADLPCKAMVLPLEAQLSIISGEPSPDCKIEAVLCGGSNA